MTILISSCLTHVSNLPCHRQQTDHRHNSSSHPPNSDERIPRLVALHPDIRLDRLSSLQEFQELLVGLAQVCSGEEGGSVR